MSKVHYIVPEGVTPDPITVRLGASGDAAGNLTTAENGKLVKFVGESQYDLADVGDFIKGRIHQVEVKTEGGWTVGGVTCPDTMFVVADGSEAAGTGNLAVGDYVVAGAKVAKKTPLSVSGTPYPKVRKATNQLGSVPADLTAAAYQAKYAAEGAWKVVSLYRSGSGAPGTIVVIQKQN
jgi:hypothetical protein